MRKKDFDDHPTPSGNSMLAYVLLRLARIWGDDELERRAAGVFRLVLPLLDARAVRVRLDARALDLYLSPPRELALHRPAGRRRRPRRARALGPERGRRIRARRGHPAARGKTRVDGKPTLYECERFACRRR